MNYKLKRFIETTIPLIILYGLTVLILTYKLGLGWGFLAIGVFTIVDVILAKDYRFTPRNIEYDGKEFPTLIQLIDYIKKIKVKVR